MNKVLDTIDLKEKGIEIKVIENNGIKTIEIISAKDCNIIYDGKVVLENIKSEFSLIPIQIRDKVKKYSEYIESNKTNKNITNFCMYINDSEYYCEVDMFIFDEKKSFLKMTNWFNSYEKIAELNEKFNTNRNKNKYKKKVEELEDIARRKGYRFLYSHDGDNYDECYTLEVPIKDFDLENVKSFLSLWNIYNNELKKYIPD